MRLLPLVILLAPALSAQNARLAEVQSVYLLPMGNALDQYLANRLAGLGVFRVVADPKKADAVFTDRLGEGFEARLDQLYPPQPAAEAKKSEKEEDKPKQEAPERLSTWGRGKGTVFLVDARTREVLWSRYERPKSSTPGDLDHTAERIADRLKRDLTGK